MDNQSTEALKVWLEWCWDTRATADPQTVSNQIRECDPDRIIIWCCEEIGWDFIFGQLLDKLTPWLQATQKTVDLIVPQFADQIVLPHVRTSQGYGCILNVLGSYHAWVRDLDDKTNAYVNSGWPNMDCSQHDKLYTCYNRRVPPERALMIDALVRENLLDRGIVTAHIIHDLPWKHHDGSVLTGDEPEPQRGAELLYPPSYHRGMIDIVNESFYDQGEFIISEKTLRSIMAFKPFLPLSCRDFCYKYLRDFLGLELYTEMFDYSFDSCDNVSDRVEGIVANIKRLSQLPMDELMRLRNQTVRKMVRNKHRIIDIYLNLQDTLPQCMQFLLDGSQYQLFGRTDLHVIKTIELLNGRRLI